MKKIMLLFMVILFSHITVVANPLNKNEEDLKLDISLYGGYNGTGLKPVFGTILGFETFFLRADIDIGLTSVNHQLCKKSFFTLSPAIGVCYGNKHKVYIMGGFENYAYIATTLVTNCRNDVFCTDGLCGKLKLGYQYYLYKKIFLSTEISHLFVKKQMV